MVSTSPCQISYFQGIWFNKIMCLISSWCHKGTIKLCISRIILLCQIRDFYINIYVTRIVWKSECLAKYEKSSFHSDLTYFTYRLHRMPRYSIEWLPPFFAKYNKMDNGETIEKLKPKWKCNLNTYMDM